MQRFHSNAFKLYEAENRNLSSFFSSHDDGSTCETNSSNWNTIAGCTAKVLAKGAINY